MYCYFSTHLIKFKIKFKRIVQPNELCAFLGQKITLWNKVLTAFKTKGFNRKRYYYIQDFANVEFFLAETRSELLTLQALKIN